jgi:hypothetical protein
MVEIQVLFPFVMMGMNVCIVGVPGGIGKKKRYQVLDKG